MAIQNVVIKEQEAAIAKATAEQESSKAQIAAQIGRKGPRDHLAEGCPERV